MIFNYIEFRESQNSFNSSGGNLKYIDKGSGEVILLLHGVPSSSWLYRKMINPLVHAGYRVIAPDMLGFGNSGNPSNYDLYYTKEHARRLIELMDHLGIKQWNHLLHDAGGLWTWELFKQDPARIQKLIILNTIICEDGFNPPLRMKEGWMAKFIMSLYRNRFISKILVRSLFKDAIKNFTLKSQDLEGYITPLVEGRTNAMYHFFSKTCNALPKYDTLFKSIDIPICVIWGEYDTMLQWAPQSNKIKETLRIKEENIHLLDAKHFIQEENSKEIVDIVLEFLLK